jgi:hypothetical protein
MYCPAGHARPSGSFAEAVAFVTITIATVAAAAKNPLIDSFIIVWRESIFDLQ